MRVKSNFGYRARNKVMRHYRSADGHTIYAEMMDGSRRRIFPWRPWRGKSERRRVIKARREAAAYIVRDEVATF